MSRVGIGVGATKKHRYPSIPKTTIQATTIATKAIPAKTAMSTKPHCDHHRARANFQGIILPITHKLLEAALRISFDPGRDIG